MRELECELARLQAKSSTAMQRASPSKRGAHAQEEMRLEDQLSSKGLELERLRAMVGEARRAGKASTSA